jgi:hypothetical protein
MKCKICNDNKIVVVHGLIDEPVELPCNCKCDKKEVKISQREKLIHMNQRLNLILGYSMGFIVPYKKLFTDEDNQKYKWLLKAIENLIYLDKPLPPMP